MTFCWREAVAATWGAKWELMLPVVIVALFVSGTTTMIETAAAALAYAVIVECFITRDIHVFKGLPEVLLQAAGLMGAVLTLLSIAMGLTSYLVDAQIPDAILAWVKLHIQSQVVFLLVLNVILLVLGSVLEIYSAIIVLAPIIAPIGNFYGVDPIHLGVIFLANLEMGFLLPPVGLEPVPVVLAVRQAADGAVQAHHPVPDHHGGRRAADHLRGRHVAGRAEGVGEASVRFGTRDSGFGVRRRTSDKPRRRVAEALPICAQGGQAKVTRAQMGTARTGPAAEDGRRTAMDLKLVPVAIPENANVIIGQSHFIKTVEDLYEIMVTSVPRRGLRPGVQRGVGRVPGARRGQ